MLFSFLSLSLSLSLSLPREREQEYVIIDSLCEHILFTHHRYLYMNQELILFRREFLSSYFFLLTNSL